ncbi:SDR family oxidoreductase [Streptomyces sp. NPDC060322]|uniref:SDR family oxidoreductase n=1 Tax=Streptomyces sp. NPDC060322 TaxID=3347097 RepID=UPI00364D7E95
MESVTVEEMTAGMRGKLLGQVALAQRAMRHLRHGGSVTLTGGTFAAPLPGGSLGALINTRLEGFVRNAAGEIGRELRINLISPGWIKETLRSMGADDSEGTPVADVAQAYVLAVEGTMQGQTLRP